MVGKRSRVGAGSGDVVVRGGESVAGDEGGIVSHSRRAKPLQRLNGAISNPPPPNDLRGAPEDRAGIEQSESAAAEGASAIRRSLGSGSAGAGVGTSRTGDVAVGRPEPLLESAGEFDAKRELQLATAKLSQWRKSATAGVAALPGMRDAVEQMDARFAVLQKLRGEQ